MPVFVLCSSVPHTRSLEARIKEELVAQGLLDSEERPGPGGDSEDEVLAELQKRQAELKALSAHNRGRKQELLRWENWPKTNKTWRLILVHQRQISSIRFLVYKVNITHFIFGISGLVVKEVKWCVTMTNKSLLPFHFTWNRFILSVYSLLRCYHLLLAFFFLIGWPRRRCVSRSWGRECGSLTMKWWKDFGDSWQPGRRNALQPRRRKTRHGNHWRRERASWSCWMDSKMTVLSFFIIINITFSIQDSLGFTNIYSCTQWLYS